MRAAESGKEIVECDLVRHINRRQAKAPFVTFLVFEKVVIPQAEVEQIAGSNARWIVIVIRRSRCWNLD